MGRHFGEVFRLIRLLDHKQGLGIILGRAFCTLFGLALARRRSDRASPQGVREGRSPLANFGFFAIRNPASRPREGRGRFPGDGFFRYKGEL